MGAACLPGVLVQGARTLFRQSEAAGGEEPFLSFLLLSPFHHPYQKKRSGLAGLSSVRTSQSVSPSRSLSFSSLPPSLSRHRLNPLLPFPPRNQGRTANDEDAAAAANNDDGRRDAMGCVHSESEIINARYSAIICWKHDS